MIDFLPMFCDAIRCKDLFHLALLNNFGSLASCMSVMMHEPVHCLAASPLSSVMA